MAVIYYMPNPKKVPKSVDEPLSRGAVLLGTVIVQEIDYLWKRVRIDLHLEKKQRELIGKLDNRQNAFVIECHNCERYIIPNGLFWLPAYPILSERCQVQILCCPDDDGEGLYVCVKKEQGNKEKICNLITRIETLERKVAELEGDIDYLESK